MVNLPAEKLGSFYLGARYDVKQKTITPEAINYDSRDLTTHAVCVGMTGSGKTGLCIGLLEEAAIDKVPAIIIDPKGDMTNLLLQFEDLSPQDFQEWINPDDAGRKGMSVEDYAAKTANMWKSGLADWGQGTERIRDLKNAVDYTIYTPGSNAGVPVNIMGSFAAPGIDFDSDAEMLRERIQGTVAALLGMVGSKEDPVRSREGILLSTLFEHYWRNNEDLDLAKLIQGIQKPPFSQLGVFDIETFFPGKDRFELAMSFNTLVASPQFSYWLQGDALDIDKIYYTADGQPRHSIFYIAHLSESERMFFVTLLLNSLITWMRRQSGTTSLRSLVYFDEIFGYFPPTANPPSKKPLLTILKQARAFGVGAVLVTQNPVDIDYKGLSNAGTWFIGKLQTERDKERVLSGLEGAIAEAGAGGGKDFDKIITALSSRVFLYHNVHEDEPVVFHTRWVMSYLTGPLTRPQVKELMQAKKETRKSKTPAGISKATHHRKTSGSKKTAAAPPSIDPAIDQRFFSVRKSEALASAEVHSNEPLTLVYEPMILATGKVRFYDKKRNIDLIKRLSFLSTAPDDFGRSNWNEAIKIVNWESNLLSKPDNAGAQHVEFEDVPDSINTKKELSSVEKEFSDWLYQSQAHKTLEHPELKMYQGEDESEEAFQMRLQQAAREKRDEEIDELQDRYEPKLERIRDRIRREENELEEHQAEVSDRKRAEWLNVAETVFSVFVKRRSRSLSSVTSKRRMARRAAQKLESTRDELEDLQEDYTEMEEELNEKLDEIRQKWENFSEGITTEEVKPRRADVKVDGIILTWHPYWQTASGDRVSAMG